MPQPPNLQKMLAEAQAMLAAQQEAQEKLKEQKVEATAGGGMVKVEMTGDLRIESLVIDPDAVDPEDVEMLQDMVVAAINEAIRKAEELQQSQLGGAEQGFDDLRLATNRLEHAELRRSASAAGSEVVDLRADAADRTSVSPSEEEPRLSMLEPGIAPGIEMLPALETQRRDPVRIRGLDLIGQLDEKLAVGCGRNRPHLDRGRPLSQDAQAVAPPGRGGWGD